MRTKVAGKAILSGVISCVLAGATCCAGNAGRDKAETVANPEQVVTLTPEHPAASFPINRETLAGSPPILRLPVTEVVNPARTPIGIYVYLCPARKSAEKLLVGNFALFPPDHPGAFLMGASKAWADLRSRGYPGDVGLRVELKRIHPEKPWTRLKITVAPPQWLRK